LLLCFFVLVAELLVEVGAEKKNRLSVYVSGLLLDQFQPKSFHRDGKAALQGTVYKYRFFGKGTNRCRPGFNRSLRGVCDLVICDDG